MELVALALGIVALVLAAMLFGLRKELRQMAQFLKTRSSDSNSRVRVSSRDKSVIELAQAVNDELDTSQTTAVEMERSKRELQENLVFISHDIRTPLMGAQGYVQLLEEESDPSLQARHVAVIKRRLIDLRLLLDQLYVFTQAQSAEHTPELVAVDANAILCDVLAQHYQQFTEKGIEPQVTLESESCLVLGDEETLVRIFQNLTTNVLRHALGSFSVAQIDTPEGATIRFSNTVAHPGMLNTEKLFDRFYRGDASRTTGGTGLGLAIVKRLAQTMNASVHASLDEEVLTVLLLLQKTK